MMGQPITEERVLTTGLPLLDSALGGGLSVPSMTMIISRPGAGSSTLCFNLMWNALMRERYCYYASFDRSERDVRNHLMFLGYAVAPYENEGRFFIYDVLAHMGAAVNLLFAMPVDSRKNLLIKALSGLGQQRTRRWGPRSFLAVWDSLIWVTDLFTPGEFLLLLRTFKNLVTEQNSAGIVVLPSTYHDLETATMPADVVMEISLDSTESETPQRKLKVVRTPSNLQKTTLLFSLTDQGVYHFKPVDQK